MRNRLRKTSNIFKRIFIGKSLNPLDKGILHHVSLIAFFAWVGLGSDGLSSSVYGPAEAFTTLQHYPYLAIFVALASVFTIFVISQSYSQIIEKFPHGGGGYVVASKLLSPTMGMISGSALLIDYVLTITISIASGADAIFSFLPPEWHQYKIMVALIGIFILIILNLRGAKESVTPLIPIFLVFIGTHAFVILYALIHHTNGLGEVIHNTHAQVRQASADLGVLGMLFLILRGYSMGAGTYTGIEAISNGVAILREPRVQTAKRTMLYMTLSLSFMVIGLMLAYIFLNIVPHAGKTLNALLLEGITQSWPVPFGHIFTLITLVSEAAILFVAAQTGFFDGPRVLSNMALDRWFPSKFAMLSDRLVTQKGVLMMGIAALITMVLTHGSVEFLIVLYSINVFITFVLSQWGMTKFWIEKRKQYKDWIQKVLINGTGLILTVCILVSMIILKFNQGGWITLLMTGSLIGLMMLIKRHYLNTAIQLRKLDKIMTQMNTPEFIPTNPVNLQGACNPKDRTAVLLVNGFTGLGLHTLSQIHEAFPGIYTNFVFLQVGLIDAGIFKGEDEVERLQRKSQTDIQRYVDLMTSYGYYAEGISISGLDIAEEITNAAPNILGKFPHAIFFGGQLVFPEDSLFTKWLHNSVVFTVQEKLYRKGIPFMILPVRV